MLSRYDNIDETKWQHIQVRVSPRLKEEVKICCKLDETDISELTRSFLKAYVETEQYDPQPMPALNRFENAFNRVLSFKRRTTWNNHAKVRNVA